LALVDAPDLRTLVVRVRASEQEEADETHLERRGRIAVPGARGVERVRRPRRDDEPPTERQRRAVGEPHRQAQRQPDRVRLADHTADAPAHADPTG
jgi:hypothetical protein